MPLHTPDPPTDVPDKVKTKLHEFAAGAKFSTKALKGAQADHLDLSTPHQVFTLGLNDITSGAGLAAAQPVGWRYLVMDSGQLIASAETALAPDGSNEVSQFTEGPFVAATDKVLHDLRKLPQLEAAGFELRLLRISALYVMALWLHAPATDLLVPLPPSPIKKDGKPMPPTEFFADLAELASSTAPLPPV
jgi:hypothetical protein